MGEARRRGTFEERRAQAIREGRVKRKTERRTPTAQETASNSTLMLGMALMAGLRSMGKKARRKAKKS